MLLLCTNLSNIKTEVLKARYMMVITSTCIMALTLQQRNTLSSFLNMRPQEEQRLCHNNHPVRQWANLMKRASFWMKWLRDPERMTSNLKLVETNRLYQLWSTVIIDWSCRRRSASRESAPIRLHSMLMETKGIRESRGHPIALLLVILSLMATRTSKRQPLSNFWIKIQLPTRAEGSLPLLCPRVSREKKSSRIHPHLTIMRASLKRHSSEAYHSTRCASPQELLDQDKAQESLSRRDHQKRAQRTISTLICKRVRGQAKTQSNIQLKLRRTKQGKARKISRMTELSIGGLQNREHLLPTTWSIKIPLATLSTSENLNTAKPPGRTS